ncbi:MAG: CHAT domain-containing protein [Kovacikia sp.]
MLWVFLSLLLSVGLPVVSTAHTKNVLAPQTVAPQTNDGSAKGLTNGPPAKVLAGRSPAQVEPQPASSQGRQLLQQGILLYETERFSEAVGVWQRAFLALQGEADRLGQALALNNLSLAYQQLGQWLQAKDAIAQGLAILKEQELSARPQPYLVILAKALNTQGTVLWSQGQTERALKTWQQAAQRYQESGDRHGTLMAQINQVKALQDLGLNIRAVDLLEQVSHMLAQEPTSGLKAAGLRYLGEAYRRIGKLEQSQQVLQASVVSAPDSESRGAALLELGNTEKFLSNQAIAIGKVEQAQAYAQAASHSYQTAAQVARASTVQLQAKLNQLKLLIETGRWLEASNLWPQIQPLITQLPLSRTTVYAQLNFAASLSCLKQLSSITKPACISPERWDFLPESMRLKNLPAWEQIARLIQDSIQQSRVLQDTLAETYALGQLGGLYELNRQWPEAQRLTQQALLRLEGMQAPEAAYQSYWQLGRVLNQQQKIPEAIAAYKEAIHALDTVQRDLLLISLESRFSFRDKVEPIYREFVNLLLTPGASNPPSQANLQLAIQTVDGLQLVELKNFLGCDLPLVRIDKPEIDPTAAKIYPILLKERAVIIFELPGQPLSYYETPASRREIEATIRQLRRYVTDPGQTPEVLQEASKLYQWLFAPLEPILARHQQIKTLVFVPDGELRNIPMGVLYDGNQYLIEKDWAIAVTPRLELFQPKPLSPRLSILAGGVGISQVIQGQSFSPIAQLHDEIAQIPARLLPSPPLFDQAFTIANIEQHLKTGRYSAIHWKTHGVFSSNPAETFIVAYQSSIGLSDLVKIIQSARQRRSEPLELLILSACETARGDNRAVLGMAGTAMNAGASSILSTLWRADDAANTALIADFYQTLSKPGATRAEALRQAQLALISKYGYSAPYYWATYVLVGNWL